MGDGAELVSVNASSKNKLESKQGSRHMNDVWSKTEQYTDVESNYKSIRRN